jgi:hypothetical protein
MALVYKTLQSEALDRFYSGSPKPLDQQLQYGRGLMKGNPTKLSDAARPPENDRELEAGSANDLDLWVAAPNGKDVERIMRLGYEAAIDLASNNKPEAKPIETFFVVGASSNFELHICDGERAVTVFMFMPEKRSYGSKRASSRSWVVRVGGLRERAKKEQLDEEVLPVVKTQVSGVKE